MRVKDINGRVARDRLRHSDRALRLPGARRLRGLGKHFAGGLLAPSLRSVSQEDPVAAVLKKPSLKPK